jgi:Kef-type K+ transport system membrane component KefB
MDDVVGLVMVNIITTLGAGGTSGWPIARPIVASFGMLLVTLVIVPFGLKTFWIKVIAFFSPTSQHTRGKITEAMRKLIQQIPHLSFLISTVILIIFVIIASFTDTSVLFAAFIAGGVVNYLWTSPTPEQSSGAPIHQSPLNMYEEYYKPVMDTILVPFFFVSLPFLLPK